MRLLGKAAQQDALDKAVKPDDFQKILGGRRFIDKFVRRAHVLARVGRQNQIGVHRCPRVTVLAQDVEAEDAQFATGLPGNSEAGTGAT